MAQARLRASSTSDADIHHLCFASDSDPYPRRTGAPQKLWIPVTPIKIGFTALNPSYALRLSTYCTQTILDKCWRNLTGACL
jgi:hypothetical protein